MVKNNLIMARYRKSKSVLTRAGISDIIPQILTVIPGIRSLRSILTLSGSLPK